MEREPEQGPDSPSDAPNVDRYELAAALLGYDDAEAGTEPSYRALNSAVLSPFRHILTKQELEDPERERDADPDQFFNPDRASTVFPGAYSARLSSDLQTFTNPLERTSSEWGRAVGAGTEDGVHRRYSMSVGGSLHGIDDAGGGEEEQEERLATEWGLGSYISQLGSPGPRDSRVLDGDDSHLESLRKDAVEERDGDDHLETRSLPDLSRMSGSSRPSAEVLDALDETDARSTTRIRIIERPSAARTRPQTAFELPTFDWVPSTAEERPASALFANSFATPNFNSAPSTRSASVSVSAILSQAFDNDEAPRPSSSLSNPISRPISRLSVAPSTELIDRSRTSLSNDGRPASALSMSAPSIFTSRFDPAMLALAREEAQKERPVFLNKEAGSPPKIVLMPAPLADRPPSPPRRERTEGPGPEEEEEAPEGPVEEELPARPAGALYGRSLMDVLQERKGALKAQQRTYDAGQDGRRSMMDWGKSPAGKAIGPGGLPKSSTMASVFGPDLLYQREMEKKLVLEKAEAEQKAKAEEARLEEEKRKLEKQKKRSTGGKMRSKSFLGKTLDGDESWQVVTPALGLREDQDLVSSPPGSPPRSPLHARRPSIAPSLALPSALNDQGLELDSAAWLPPRAPSPASSASSHREYIRGPTPDPSLARQLGAQAGHGRNAIALSAEEQSIAFHRSLTMKKLAGGGRTQTRANDGGSSESSDSRPLAEQLASQIRPLAPPVLALDLGSDFVLPRSAAELEDEDEDDIPLGRRLTTGQFDDDDVPLALRHQQHRALYPSAAHDDDDVPLALASVSLHQQHQQQQAFHLQAQAQQQMEAAMLFQYQQQQHFGGQPHMFASGMGPHGIVSADQMSFVATSYDGGSGPAMEQGNRVDAWRRGVGTA